MASIKGFIFDLDGVIVDTAKYHFKAWQRLANDLGIHFDEEQNEQLKGVSRRESLQKILSWGNISLEETEFEQRMAQKNDWYLELIGGMKATEALPGAKDFLKESLAMGLKVALGSASKNAVLILDHLELSKDFEAIIDGTKISRSKPDPQVFQLGAEALGLKAEEIVVFEDAVAGVEAALAGGFRCVGIGEPKVLSAAEMVVPGLHAIRPSEVINKLNF